MSPIEYIFPFLPILLFSVVIHEFAHGYVAFRYGDYTAKYAGRLTLNPIPHLDIFGSILVPFLFIISGSKFFIAWAKPVPVNPYNLRNPRKDSVKVSAAGPLSNLSLAFAFSLIYIFLINTFPNIAAHGITKDIIINGIWLNSILCVFNLLPVPPLDGSHILEYFLPPNIAIQYQKIQRYGFIILFIFIFMLPFSRTLIFFPAEFLFNMFVKFIATFS